MFGTNYSNCARVCLVTQDGRTALDTATQFQGADSEVVQILTKVGAKTGKQVKCGLWEIH